MSVQLRGHDFTGLGFKVTGNMRDGIFIKDISNRGPAFESGKIAPGTFAIFSLSKFSQILFKVNSKQEMEKRFDSVEISNC